MIIKSKIFKNIDKKYRPIPFWSWNEKLSTDETLFQIEEMEKQGIGGFFMHARGGLQTEYMGDEWFENVRACIEKCKGNGMKPWVYDENGWPSGFGSGKVNGKGVEYQQKYLRFEKGEKTTDTTIANIDGYHFYYEVNPFYIDALDAKVVKEFIKVSYQPYYDKFKGEIDGFFTDEPQMSRVGFPWSLVLPNEYKAEYGEDLLEKLPQLFFAVGDYKKTRMKFWRLVTMLFSKNFVKQIYDWCNEHGFKFTGHFLCEETLFSQLTPNGACMPHYEYMTIPGMDWLGRHNTDTLTPYQVGSVARQLGKKQVLSETFALCGHNVGHDELKWIYEHQMVRGANLLCQHLQGYSNRGLRKRDYPPAMYIQQPWWNDSKMFNDAMSRIGMLLSEGDDGVDVLVIHPQTTAWTMYDGSIIYDEWNIPWGTDIMKLHKDFMDILLELEKKHINFHLGDEIIMERHAKVEGDMIVIGNKKYSKIILPRHEILFENTERLLKEFRANGGIVTEPDELQENKIIDIPEITYCERHCKNYDMYYFVNSTENTYDAHIAKGSKVMDVVTGKISGFDGKHTFHKYESLVVIDDQKARTEKQISKNLTSVDLSGIWKVKECSENIITMDYCDYYFDGRLEEKNGYILNAMYRALDIGKPINIRCDFRFTVEYIPEKLYLVCETPEIFDITLNGMTVDKISCGYFLDKAFVKLDISRYLLLGENFISLDVDFRQSKDVYENIEKAKKFESEKNKLTLDMEIEQIYLVGDFSVKTEGIFKELERNACRYKGNFVIAEPKEEIVLQNIERQGFPFFAGEITLSKRFIANDKNMILDFNKCGVNIVKAKINGKELQQFMWEPYSTDISEFINKGSNDIELTLVNNLRNMQGPFHLGTGESYLVTPSDFYKENCVWFDGKEIDRWNDEYCFTSMSINNRQM